tara:strand:+ start:237 stop:431 length:195 start_codon:yes stop_codon:yes gene_type:complete
VKYDDLTFTSFEGVVLLIVMVYFGNLFRRNWIKKEDFWVLKAWIFGLASTISFLIIAFFPLKIN